MIDKTTHTLEERTADYVDRLERIHGHARILRVVAKRLELASNGTMRQTLDTLQGLIDAIFEITQNNTDPIEQIEQLKERYPIAARRNRY
jgi:hypothetical protein